MGESSTTLSFIKLDLGNLSSVQAAADNFLKQESQLDILMCVAGIMALPPGLTDDGYELQFGTNHLGHALLIKKILPVLEHTAKVNQGTSPRIIIFSSKAYEYASEILLEQIRTGQDSWFLGRQKRYQQSKLANVLYAHELARHYPDVTTVSLHPGSVVTGMWDSMPAAQYWLMYLITTDQRLSLEQGTFNGIWLAGAPREALVSGGFYEPVGRHVPNVHGTTKVEEWSKKLWNWTEGELERWM